MPVDTPAVSGVGRFVDTDGRSYAEKPEHLTHLRGSTLVEKTHPRILLRGKLDSCQAKTLEVGILAAKERRQAIVDGLDEILEYLREILAAEVKEEPLDRTTLLGMDEAELRAVSHNPRPHFGIGHIVPNMAMAPCLIGLNALRTLTRETELACVAAFRKENGSSARPDLVQALNRLSSAIYIMICRECGRNNRKTAR